MTGTTYVAFVRDHSASMSRLAGPAMRDFNGVLAANQKNHDAGKSVVFGTVVEFSDIVRTVTPLKPISAVDACVHYDTPGNSTRLWDGVMAAVKNLGGAPVQDDTAFLVLVTTDGQENASQTNLKTLIGEIDRLTATDKWTFVFRVPRGCKSALVAKGLPAENIIEWDQNERSMKETETRTTLGFDSFYEQRTRGVTSTKSFYADTERVSMADVERRAIDVTGEARSLPVMSKHNDSQIRDFVVEHVGSYVSGKAFYQLTKSETVQDYKLIALRHKQSGKIYCGPEARRLIGLPTGSGEVKLSPGSSPNYDVFVQSTSVNRKVKQGTHVLYFG